MTNDEILTVRAIERAIDKIIEGLSVYQLIGNVEFNITAHEWPGTHTTKRSSKTGYGFNFYLDYFEKGNAGTRHVVMDVDLDANRPGATIYEHVSFEKYLRVLHQTISELHRRFDLNKIAPHLGSAYAALFQSVINNSIN